jgi:hypothetical protein
MSNALAISGVTAVLQYYLTKLYASAPGMVVPVTVSCLAPDQVHHGLGDADRVESQVNLFMHQVTRNASWRNVELASMSADGTQRLKSPPLGLDLHYLLTVYGSEYWQAEALLGYALMMLHEAPVLTRQDITDALTMLTAPPPPLTPPYPTNALTPVLATCGLADQVEMIKITPETMGREEMAWLWTALKSDYRPTFPFQVSVVLLQPDRASSFALPVLHRHIGATPVQPSLILQVQPPNHQAATEPGGTVTVTGEFLSGATRVVLTNARHGIQLMANVTPVGGSSLTFVLPPDMGGAYPAGIYDLAVQFLNAAGTSVEQTTNVLPIGVAPTLPTQAAVVAVNPAGMLVTVNFTPEAWEGQTISLALSTLAAPLLSVSAPAESFSGKVSTLKFQFAAGVPTGTGLLGRLVIDGVSSQVAVDWTFHPPVFTGPLVTL